ncbi:MAG: alpha/beta hydrolase [Pirellulaceae bacterium]|jgi:pimeloyl-ACP methyl ester carboxylesterase|nr:alpha/beta hydrolase [Pirellulaceae bacterium]
MIAALCLSLSGGCSYFRTTTISRPEDGLTIVLPGIEGASFVNSNIAQGLVDGQVPGQVEVFDWTSGNALRSLEHLSDARRVSEQATRLADHIEESHEVFPDRPISVVAHSGGAGVALAALEKLPEHREISALVLLAPAVSPNYPIQRATSKTTSGVWSFYSPLDAQLTVGTSLFGTIDGEYGPAAGSSGFNTKPEGLTEVPFEPGMMRTGNLGGHLGGTHFEFVREHVAPIIRRSHYFPLSAD